MKLTQYRLVAIGHGVWGPRWHVQRRVTLFGFHLWWWNVTECSTQYEGEQAFAAITTPGKYGERL